METPTNFPFRVQYTKEYLTENVRIKQRSGTALRLTRGYNGVLTIKWDGSKAIGYVHITFLEPIQTTKNKLPPMSNKQLPADVQERIKADAKAYMHAEIKGMIGDEEFTACHLSYAYEAGAAVETQQRIELELKYSALQYEHQELKDQLARMEQSKIDGLDVFVPCGEDDPESCGSYTSHDGRSLCYVKVKHLPANKLTQERADLIREANNRDLDGAAANEQPTFWDVAKAFKWAAEYRDEIGGQLTLNNDQWALISEDEDGNENETQDLTPGNVAELYCLQKGFIKGGMPKLEDGPILNDDDMKAWEENEKEEKQ